MDVFRLLSQLTHRIELWVQWPPCLQSVAGQVRCQVVCLSTYAPRWGFPLVGCPNQQQFPHFRLGPNGWYFANRNLLLHT